MILGPERVEPREEEMGVQRRIEKSMTKATGLKPLDYFLITCKGLKITASQKFKPQVMLTIHACPEKRSKSIPVNLRFCLFVKIQLCSLIQLHKD